MFEASGMAAMSNKQVLKISFDLYELISIFNLIDDVQSSVDLVVRGTLRYPTNTWLDQGPLREHSHVRYGKWIFRQERNSGG